MEMLLDLNLRMAKMAKRPRATPSLNLYCFKQDADQKDHYTHLEKREHLSLIAGISVMDEPDDYEKHHQGYHETQQYPP